MFIFPVTADSTLKLTGDPSFLSLHLLPASYMLNKNKTKTTKLPEPSGNLRDSTLVLFLTVYG